MKELFNHRPFSGVFMTVFLGLAGLMALPAALNSYSITGYPSADGLIRGGWSKLYEKNFTKNLPAYEPSLHLWGESELILFREGKRGVLIGDDGWLFSAEEFEYPKDAQQNSAENFSFIQSVKNILTKKNTKLIIALIPSKARVEEKYLGRYFFPAYRKNLYEESLTYFLYHNISVVDLMDLQDLDRAFLKTDTHWSPEGAAWAAKTIAKKIHSQWSGLELPHMRFTQEKNADIAHSGDLLRYIPAKTTDIDPDMLETSILIAENSEKNLFADVDLAVVLVGTSYSAEKLWRFEDALKESLRTDILNVSDPAIGPFQSMKNYLSSADFKNNTPKLVIWEIPERYLPFEDGRTP